MVQVARKVASYFSEASVIRLRSAWPVRSPFVPQVFIAMLEALLPSLETGAPVLSRSVVSPFGEGDIGTQLTAIQKAHPETSIGSYPRFDGNRFSTEIVIRSRDEAPAEAAEKAILAMIAEIAADKAAD